MSNSGKYIFINRFGTNMSQILIDKNGWINPTCPKCECVMEFNYTNWHKSGKHVFQYPDLNMYCRYCHYAVHIKPATVDATNAAQTDYDIQVYSNPIGDEE